MQPVHIEQEITRVQFRVSTRRAKKKQVLLGVAESGVAVATDGGSIVIARLPRDETALFL